MYRLIRIYGNGEVVIGKILYHYYHLEELTSLINMIHPYTFELAIGLEIE